MTQSAPTSLNLPRWTFEPRARADQPAYGPVQLATRIRSIGAELAFAGLGFASVEPFLDAQQVFEEWIKADYHGEMTYLSAGPRHAPQLLMPGAQSLVIGAISASAGSKIAEQSPPTGKIARYALGGDYHLILRQKLAALGQAVADLCGRPIHGRVCVDTAPLLEREAARRAGLGFIGKSNLLIMPGLGSHVLLGALLLDVEIAIDAPMEQRCGRCKACLDACPTQAFVGPFVLDARRCISYLTIEYRGWIDRALRPLMGTHVFGCDICQDICPYNHGKGLAPSRALHAPEASLPNVELSTWLTLTSSGYRRLATGTALRRASRWQLLRNAAIAAGNSGDFGLVELLVRLLTDSKYPIVRGHAAWALGHLGNSNAIFALQTALQREHESAVLEEIEHALRNSPRAL